MSKTQSRLSFSTTFMLDYTLAVLTVISVIFSLVNFWHLFPGLTYSNLEKLSTNNTEPPRWVNISTPTQSKEPPEGSNSISGQYQNLESGLKNQLVTIPDNQIEEFTKILTRNNISLPVKISSNIYQIKSSSSDKENLDKLIQNSNIVSSSDDELFMLQDQPTRTKKITSPILESKTSQDTPTPKDLDKLPPNLPLQEITNSTELSKLAILPKDQYIGSQWHLIDPKLDIKLDIKPVIVAVIDGGVDISHPDLVDAIAQDSNGQILGWNYWDNTPIQLTDISSKLDEAYGHGTHVAGTIGASNNEIGISGSCLNTCQIMPLKVFGGVNSSGRISSAIKAIDYAVTNGAKIINLSWGSRNYNSILAQSIATAQSKGVTFVAASGNNAEDNILYPAKLADVISVGSLDRQGNKSKTTNFGSGITKYAPGVDILATSIPSSNTCTTENKSFDNGLYNYCSGTSMATAVTSGILAKKISEKE